MSEMLHGIAASFGIGMGKVVCIEEQNTDYSHVVYQGCEQEHKRLETALAVFEEQTRQMADEVRRKAGEKEAEILQGQIMMLNDPLLLQEMQERIDLGSCAEAATDAVCSYYAALFESMDDEMMKQRSTDIRDIRDRMLGILLNRPVKRISSLPKGTVLAAKDLTPSMTVGLDKEAISAIVTEIGGKTAHSAILARALEIPAVLGIENAMNFLQDGQFVVVDGEKGTVELSPDTNTVTRYQALQAQQKESKKQLEEYRNRPTADADGKQYRLYANIGTPEQANLALEQTAEGIGLFRTEFLFMDRDRVPSEEEQMQAYLQVSRIMKGKEVIIRTLDVGGDKEIPYLHMEREQNPFLGWRAIRYCLEESELFQIQLRALLRAGAENRNIKIMLPLVTGLEEVEAAKRLLEQCKEQCKAQGQPYDETISLGVMIETPAAALTADLFAEQADFFSIGTNDLTQYTMAVDRGNAKVEKLYTVFHPAVLRSIRTVIKAAKQRGIPVGMCGESAADERLIPLLLSFGLDEFSVSPSSVLQTRKNIARWNAEQQAQLERRVMQAKTATQVQQILSEFFTN